jgi:hypothetical protein
MMERMRVKGRSDDIALLKACYRMFFPEWEIEDFPRWLKDIEDAVEGRTADLPQPCLSGALIRNRITL